jgi:PAS domain-containing protein
MVCDGLHIHLNSGAPATRMRVPHVLSLSLLKLDGARLMAVLQDVSEQVRRERQLRQSDAWLNALLTSISDYALVGLDQEGRISCWNETIGRVTGFSRRWSGSRIPSSIPTMPARRSGCTTACAKPTPTAGAWKKARACAPTAASSGAAP